MPAQFRRQNVGYGVVERRRLLRLLLREVKISRHAVATYWSRPDDTRRVNADLRAMIVIQFRPPAQINRALTLLDGAAYHVRPFRNSFDAHATSTVSVRMYGQTMRNAGSAADAWHDRWLNVNAPVKWQQWHYCNSIWVSDCFAFSWRNSIMDKMDKEHVS